RNVDVSLSPMGGPIAEGDFNAEVLFEDQVGIVAGKQSPWAHRRKIELAELVNEPWLLSLPDSLYGPLLAEGFQASGLVMPKTGVTSQSVHLRGNLLATGRFVAVLSTSVVRFNAERFSLKVLPIKLPVRKWPVAIVTLKNRTVGPIVQTFIDCVRQVANPMAKKSP